MLLQGETILNNVQGYALALWSRNDDIVGSVCIAIDSCSLPSLQHTVNAFIRRDQGQGMERAAHEVDKLKAENENQAHRM